MRSFHIDTLCLPSVSQSVSQFLLNWLLWFVRKSPFIRICAIYLPLPTQFDICISYCSLRHFTFADFWQTNTTCPLRQRWRWLRKHTHTHRQTTTLNGIFVFVAKPDCMQHFFDFTGTCCLAVGEGWGAITLCTPEEKRISIGIPTKQVNIVSLKLRLRDLCQLFLARLVTSWCVCVWIACPLLASSGK